MMLGTGAAMLCVHSPPLSAATPKLRGDRHPGSRGAASACRREPSLRRGPTHTPHHVATAIVRAALALQRCYSRRCSRNASTFRMSVAPCGQTQPIAWDPRTLAGCACSPQANSRCLSTHAVSVATRIRRLVWCSQCATAGSSYLATGHARFVASGWRSSGRVGRLPPACPRLPPVM
jgi:hypothetical protein